MATALSSDPVTLVVEPHESSMRLDSFLAARLTQYSRVHLRRVINAAAATVDGRRAKAAQRLRAGQEIVVYLPELPREAPQPEEIPLSVLYEDETLAVIDKPAGMVVHPARGHWSGTLASALAHRFSQLSCIGGPTRPGIVHRLDRDTSGCIVIAKNDAAHALLSAQFEARTVQKQYFALVSGAPDRDRDLIDQPIGVHPHQREKMAIRRHSDASREAQSVYEVVERFDGFAAVQVKPRTGRTHQIRVHMASIGCCVLCDRQYGGRASLTRGDLSPRAADPDVVLLARQALHAQRLGLEHPRTGQWLEFEAPIPADLEGARAALRELRPIHRIPSHPRRSVR